MTTPSPMPVAEALESLRAFHAVITDPYNKELLSTCIATLARAVEDADLFRWMQANCYFNEHDSRDWPHVVVKVCVGTLADGRIGTYLVGPENRVGIVALDVAVRQAMAAAQDAARREMA